MDPYRIERLFYDVIRYSKIVDTHPNLPRKTDQIKRIIHEIEYELEGLYSDEDGVWEGRDAAVYLAHLDTATGGWHRW